MVLVSAPFQILFSYLIRFMRHILTPTVGGVIIMLAVVGLLKDALLTWTGTGHQTGLVALLDIGTGALTIFIMLGVEWFGGKRLRPWGLPLGIIAGSLVTALAGFPVIEGLADAAWVGLPQGDWPGVVFPVCDLEHWVLGLTFVLAVFATSIKYTGDAMILQQVTDPHRKKVDYDALQGGLYSNSVGMILAGAVGGMPSSSHSANIPLMAMTGVATRRVAAVSALLLACVALSPKALLLLVNIPKPVIGGVGMVLVAHLFSSGLQLLVTEINHRNGLIAGLSLCVGIIAERGDFFPDAFPYYLDPLMKNGVALGGLLAVLLSLATLFGTHRGIVLSVTPTMENLPNFKQKLDAVTRKLGLENRAAGVLELACEELFFYMREEFLTNAYAGGIRFVFRENGTGLSVEVSGGIRFESEADEIAMRDRFCPIATGDEELNALGLVLLGRFADNVTHVNIGDYSFISFTIVDEDDAIPEHQPR